MNISLVGLCLATALVGGPAALNAAHSAIPDARSGAAPIAQSVILDGQLSTRHRLALHYVVAGNTAVYSDPATGDPILADGGELGSIRVFIGGRLRGGSDAGFATCVAHSPVREYYDQFPIQTFRVKASNIHRVRVVARYCASDGTESRTVQRLAVR
jgi:hypothetical protein